MLIHKLAMNTRIWAQQSVTNGMRTKNLMPATKKRGKHKRMELIVYNRNEQHPLTYEGRNDNIFSLSFQKN